ncbi:MAG: hypothetical protein MN733_15665, partial [Nitrososphaera sp.]|nr:hypothetical protein [Nitrososphaera sp.]
CHLLVTELPVKHEEIAKYAAKEFLVENATASVNGCHLIVATSDVSALITEDLRKHNFLPERIGLVSKKGSAYVTFAQENVAQQYVASKARLASLTAGQIQQQPAAS